MKSVHTSHVYPWWYFAIAFSWTWAFWVPAALVRRQIDAFPVPILIALGGIGTLVAALFLLYRKGNARVQRDFWKRLFDVRRISAMGYALSILMVPAMTIISALLAKQIWGGEIALEPRFQGNLWRLIPFALFTFGFGPIPEELGWRGYALEGLLKRLSPFRASVLLGIIWTAWHAPLFFVQGSYQQTLGWGTAAFWLFMIDKVCATLVMALIYIRNGHSTLTAVLFHFMMNYVGEILILPRNTEFVLIALWIVVAASIAIFALNVAPDSDR